MLEAPPKENMLQPVQHFQSQYAWTLDSECFVNIKLIPNEHCTCRREDDDYDILACACGHKPRWSLESTELFVVSHHDQDGPLDGIPGETHVTSVNDLLRVLESPTAAQRWV